MSDALPQVAAGDASPRQALSKRQASTVTALLDAGLALLREGGYDALTLRAVAARARVTHTTAYAYFTSKGHLVAEVLWRRLAEVPHAKPNPRAPLATRVADALSGPGLLFADDPALADAGLSALLLRDPDVRRLRDAIALDLARRIQTALGTDVDSQVGDAVLLAFSGAMLQAGMGYFDVAGAVSRVASMAALLDR